MTVIDFEYTNWLPHSFLIWNLRYSASMERVDWTFLEELRSRSQLKISQDNFKAINEYRINRWQSPGYLDMRACNREFKKMLNSVD